jgi:transposase-like protein
MRNVLAVVPKGSRHRVASVTRTDFAQPDARYDLLAFASFPPRHWCQIWSTNPLERVNRENNRRSRVVGVFPNPTV